MASKKSDTGKVEEYQGKTLESPIPYSFEFDVFDNVAEAQQSESWPSASEILKFVNGKAKTAAKAAAYQTATKALKEQYEATPEFKRANIIKAAVAAGMSQEAAESLAKGII